MIEARAVDKKPLNCVLFVEDDGSYRLSWGSEERLRESEKNSANLITLVNLNLMMTLICDDNISKRGNHSRSKAGARNDIGGNLMERKMNAEKMQKSDERLI